MSKSCTAIAFFLFPAMLIAQGLGVEMCYFNDNISFPYFRSAQKPVAAQRINQRLQVSYFDTVFTPQTFHAIVSDQVSMPLEHFLGWSHINARQIFQNERYLLLNMENAYEGAYSSEWQETLLFDLNTGDPAELPTLFSLDGYFDFLNQHWLGDCFEQVKEAHECETSERQLEGACYPSCFDFEGFYIRDDSLIVQTTDCYPHVLQNCNPFLEKSFSLHELSAYLNDYGKYLLHGTKPVKEVPRMWFLTGKIGDQYRICMALEQKTTDPSKLEGYYYYEKYRQKIRLEGSVKNGSLELLEFANGTLNGKMILEWREEKYAPEGYWQDKAGKKKLPVALQCFYNVDTRSILKSQ